ncbi:MAG: hypothetical protein ACRDR6_27850 [Pseudonocardiaceae bacterium]
MNSAHQKETWTVTQCAAAWKVKEVTWRYYVATDRAPQPLPGFDKQRRRRWSPEAVLDYPRPGQGQRTDLTARRIGEMFAVAKGIAGDRHYNEWSKLDEQIMSGNPGAARWIVTAARRWASHSKVHTQALARIEVLSEQVGDLGAAILPMRMRSRIASSEGAARADLQAKEQQP